MLHPWETEWKKCISHNWPSRQSLSVLKMNPEQRPFSQWCYQWGAVYWVVMAHVLKKGKAGFVLFNTQPLHPLYQTHRPRIWLHKYWPPSDIAGNVVLLSAPVCLSRCAFLISCIFLFQMKIPPQSQCPWGTQKPSGLSGKVWWQDQTGEGSADILV